MVMVVAILGILSSIALIKYGKVQDTAKLNADFTTAATIATAASIAKSDNMADSEITVENLKSKGYLASHPKPQFKSGEFKVVVDGQNITVDAGGTVLYPKRENNIESGQ